MFRPIEYLEWIEGRPAAATHDFGRSDLGEGYDGVVPDRLAGLSAPEAPLEVLIADAYGDGVEADDVLVAAGATGANLLAAAAALGDGGRALVESPGYEPLVATPEALGARVDRFERPADAGYRLDPSAVSAAADGDVDLITATNRHNPSGALTARETLSEVASVAAAADARLLVDEVYAPFLVRPREGPGTAFGAPTAAGLERTVVTGSLTKFFGFGGLRIGWLVADEAFVERAASVRRHLPHVSAPGRRLARRALANADRLAERSRERVAANHEALAAFAEHGDVIGAVPGESAIAFLGHETAGGDRVAEAAADEGVLVVPGRFFGDASRFRIAACRPPEETRAGLRALGNVLDELGD